MNVKWRSLVSNAHALVLHPQVSIISERQFLLLIQNSLSTVAPSNISAPAPTLSVPQSTPTPVSRVVKAASSFGTSSSSESSAKPPFPTHMQEESQQLWVDKYKPARLEDVIGGAESVKKLLEWLRKWHDVHIKKTAKVGSDVKCVCVCCGRWYNCTRYICIHRLCLCVWYGGVLPVGFVRWPS